MKSLKGVAVVEVAMRTVLTKEKELLRNHKLKHSRNLFPEWCLYLIKDKSNALVKESCSLTVMLSNSQLHLAVNLRVKEKEINLDAPDCKNLYWH